MAVRKKPLPTPAAQTESRPFQVSRAELVWPGKYDPKGRPTTPARSSVPFSILERIGEDDLPEAPSSTPWRNQLIWGDNLPVLSSLLDRFTGKIDLIYVDPPFATGSDFSLTTRPGEAAPSAHPSSVELPAFRDVWSQDKSSFLDMLWPRAQLMRELLSDRGLLFAHFDDNVGHEVKLLLDDVFGAANKRGEIIWQLGTGAKSRKFFSVQHNLILVYSKTDTWCFRHDAPQLREPFAEGSLQTHFRNFDENGRRYRRRVLGGKAYIYYADEGRMVGSVWTDIPSMTANSPIIQESTGYPTQKPEKLLHRILSACTCEDSLVADFFCGSGTTLAVAEKMGLRWIGCDLGRLAVHTTRKRLLHLREKEPKTRAERHCRPFEVVRLGQHAGVHGEASVVGVGSTDDVFREHVLSLYGAKATTGHHVHGRKGDAFVLVGPVDGTLPHERIEAAAAEAQRLGGTVLHVLGWEFEPGPYASVIEGVLSRHGVDVRLIPIPLEALESRAGTKASFPFFELSRATIGVRSDHPGAIQLVLEDFVFPSRKLVPKKVLARVEKWSDFVDFWAVDWDHHGVFVNRWCSYRTRRDRTLTLETPVHEYERPGEYDVRVKVVDILGFETSCRVAWVVQNGACSR